MLRSHKICHTLWALLLKPPFLSIALAVFWKQIFWPCARCEGHTTGNEQQEYWLTQEKANAWAWTAQLTAPNSVGHIFSLPPLGHVPLGNFLLILGECSFHGNLGLNMYLQTQPVCLDFGCYFRGRWCWKCHYQDESSMIELFGYGEKVSSASIVPFMKWTLKLSQFNI